MWITAIWRDSGLHDLRSKAMAHPIRLRLLAMLRRGPLCVCQMTARPKLAAAVTRAERIRAAAGAV
jgi:hypothetical protein